MALIRDGRLLSLLLILEIQPCTNNFRKRIKIKKMNSNILKFNDFMLFFKKKMWRILKKNLIVIDGIFCQTVAASRILLELAFGLLECQAGTHADLPKKEKCFDDCSEKWTILRPQGAKSSICFYKKS